MSVNANSKQIIFKSAQRSKISRENFENHDSDLNDIQAQINRFLTPPAGNEVTNARDYHVVLRDRLRSVSQGHVNQIIDGFEVLEQATPDMTIKVKAGDAIVNGVGCIKGFGTWTRVTTTVSITELSHGLSNGDKIYVDTTSSAPALPASAEYVVANVATDTFDITGIDAGNASGTCDYSRYSGTITAAAAGKHRIDVIVIDSSNTISILTGSESDDATTDPVFPTIATTQLSLRCYYVDDATASIVDANIFALKEDNDLPNFYIKQATTLNQGKYNFNNLIIDAAITIDCTSVVGLYNLQRQNIIIKCTGNIYDNGNIGIATPHIINNDGDDGAGTGTTTGATGGVIGISSFTITSLGVGKGGSGASSQNAIGGGGGGGGGASIIAAGGAGGNGSAAGGFEAPSSAGGVGVENKPFVIIQGFNITINANIDINGESGTNSVAGGSGSRNASGGGGGGDAGGLLLLISKNNIIVETGNTVSANGGDGGDSDDVSGGALSNNSGGGGGGGAGGLLLIRSKTYTNNGTVQATGGIAGAAGTATGTGSGQGSNGNAGSAGIVDQELYDDISSNLINNILPLNLFGLDI